MHYDTAAAGALFGLVTGWFVPQLIARLPEPPAAPTPPTPAVDLGTEADADLDEVVTGEPGSMAAPVKASPFPPKELYVDMARVPGLAWQAALVAAAAGAVSGGVLGWTWPLTMWLFLAPVGAALAIIDFRTWLLPTRIIWPSFGVLLALGVVGAVIDMSHRDLLRGVIGALLAFALFYLLWFLPGGGMGYGDVRLSAVLGFLLGFVGWGELGFGLWTGFLIGALAWIPLRLLRLTKNKRFPFGPFLLLGALVGLVWGAAVGAGLAA